MKLKKASKKWHRKALMIDPRKTMLILEGVDVKPEYVPPMAQNEPVEEEQISPLASKERPDHEHPEFFSPLVQDKDCLPRSQINEWSRFRC